VSVGLTPDPALREFTDLGVVAPGAQLLTLVSGTPATNLATYSDGAGAVPNTNPVVASAFGLFGPIYLTAGVAYRLICTTAAGVVLWDRDPVLVLDVASAVAAIGGLATAALNSYRLTLESGVPVSSTDQLAKTTLYCTPQTGRSLTIFSAGGVPATLTSAEFSIALPAVASQLYDVFVYSNAGVLTLELCAWTNDTTRATAIALTTTGAWCKSGDLTRRYLGTVRTTAVAGQTEDSALKRYVWNVANRVRRAVRVADAAASWTYSTAAWRQANANAANQVDVVVGVAEALLDLTMLGLVTNTNAWQAGQAIGEDAVLSPAAGLTYLTGSGAAGTANIYGVTTARLVKYPGVGRHLYVWIEFSVTGPTTTFLGTNVAGLFTTGLTGWMEG
jgi:hypothetical protein